MKRIYCDECGKEMRDPDNDRRTIVLRYDSYDADNKPGSEFLSQDLCRKCYDKVRKERKWIEY